VPAVPVRGHEYSCRDQCDLIASNFLSVDPGGDLILTASNSNFGYVPTNGNAAAVAAALEGAQGTSNSDMLSVLGSWGGLSNDQLQQALDTMHSDASGAAIEGARAVADQFIGSVGDRLAGVRTGVSTGD